MNQAVYFAFLKPGDTVLAMDLSHGGHLTHGAPVSHMGKVFNFVRYKTFPDQGGAIDFDALMQTAKRDAAEDGALRLLLLSARLRLRRVQEGGRRGRRADHGRHLPYRRAGGGRA